MDIDPNKNRATLTTPGSASRLEQSAERAKALDASDQRLKQAQERLDQARKMLADARDNPGEDEVQRAGKVGGGSRPVFTEAYERKLAQLEEAVRSAEEEVKLAERGR